MRPILLCLVLAISLSGCIFQHLSPTRKLTDQVYALNDEARWTRIDLATERVAPRYRETFLVSHRMWGHDIQIADSDTTNVHIADDLQTATSLVTISWYDQRTLELRASVLRQHWESTGDGYVLDGETVIGGDPDLLDLPEEDAEEGDSEAEDEGAIAAR